MRLTAIRAGLNRRVKDLVPPLIEALGKYEKNRDLTWLEARESLLAITGQDFESSTDWESWWEGTKAGFDPAQVGKEQGKTRVVVRKSKDAVEFFGSEIFSRNVLFVIDVSGSQAQMHGSFSERAQP